MVQFRMGISPRRRGGFRRYSDAGGKAEAVRLSPADGGGRAGKPLTPGKGTAQEAGPAMDGFFRHTGGFCRCGRRAGPVCAAAAG